MAMDSKKVTIILVGIVLVLSLMQFLVPLFGNAGDQMQIDYVCNNTLIVGSTTDYCYYNATTSICANATNDINGSVACDTTPNAIPLSGLFSSTGVLMIILMATMLIILVKVARGKK